MSVILGISAFYHDSAAALLVDGNLVAAAQEERFSRKKHDDQFPHQAVAYCLAKAGIGPQEIDHVGFYDKPFLKFERLLETYLSVAPLGLRQFYSSIPQWLGKKLHVPAQIKRALDRDFDSRFIFAEHHQSHASSAFFPSPFEEAAILTVDGVGEWASSSIGTGQGNRIKLTHQQNFPHSLGLLYAAFTSYCGFRVNSGEYKVMGLAPYGEPRFSDRIIDQIIDLKEDGSFRMDMAYFNYCQGHTMTSKKFHEFFGQLPRVPESEITQFYKDIAASIQKVAEEIMVRSAREIHRITGMKNLCMAGGVALNCVANGRILRETPFDNVWVQPASNDSGGAVGVAYYIWHQLFGKEREVNPEDSISGSLLGPHFSSKECIEVLEKVNAKYKKIENDTDRSNWIAKQLSAGRVVGLFQGAMEFGPRALGGRSILGDPRLPEMQSLINQKVKFRESFRPFAPSVLKERVGDFFDFKEGQESPYMLLVTKTLDDSLPAVTHVDGSARVQTVTPERNGFYHDLLKAFEEETGCPVLINTSFNVRGEPVVCSPYDAWRCFMLTDIDVLVTEDLVLQKEDQNADKPVPLDRKEIKKPSPAEIKWFGLLLLPFFLILYFLSMVKWDSPRIGYGIIITGGIITATYAIFPNYRSLIYRLWMAVFYPVGWLVSHLVMTLLFYLVFTPVGLLMRATGNDPLNRLLDTKIESYWIGRDETCDLDKKRALRQF